MTNKYDWRDIIRQHSVLRAASLKVAVYRVRDPETGEFSTKQYHVTENNTVLAVLPESAVCLLASFLDPNLTNLLKEILDSDMAQREEDEGNVSPLLNKIRSFVGLPQKVSE